MNGARFSIILFFLTAAGMGFLTFPRLAFDFGASHRAPTITIHFTYPHAPPEEIERTVATPIESAVALIEGVDAIKSEISNGSGFTRLGLDKGVSLDFIRFQVAQVLRQVYPELPEEAGYPSIALNDPDANEIDPTILSYSLYGKSSTHELFEYAYEVLAPKLSRIDNLQRIETEGADRLEHRLIYSEHGLEQLNLDRTDLEDLIRRHLNQEGFSRIFFRDRFIHAKMDQKAVNDLQDQLIALPGGGKIALGQLITVVKETERKNRYYRVDGRESVRLNFIPKPGSNHLKLVGEIRDEIQNIKIELPEGYALYLEFDQTEYIRAELNKIRDRTIWSVGLLLLFVLATYRSFKTSSIIVLAALVNLGLAVIGYQLFEVQLNLYALAGITVSFGIIIDNIIVMMHHYHREKDKLVFPALLTATLTTLSALFIIFVLPDTLRFELVEFAKVLGINLGLSLLIAYFFVPALIDRMGLSGVNSMTGSRNFNFTILLNRAYNRLVAVIRRQRRFGILASVLLFGLPVFWLPNQVEGWKLYNKTFGSDTYLERIRPWTNRILGGSLRLFSQYVYESSGFRTTDETVLFVTASMPMGSTIEQMDEMMRHIESYLVQFDNGIKTFVSMVNSSQYGQVRIFFTDEANASFPFILKSRLESIAIDQGGVDWNIYGVGKGFSNASGATTPRFRVMFKGYNKDHLAGYAERLAESLLDHPRISSVNANANMNWWERDRLEYVMEVDKKAINEQGFQSGDALNVMSSYNLQPSVLGYSRENEAIRLISGQLSKNTIWSLNNKLHPIDSLRLSFSSIASLKKQSVANSIHKDNQQFLQMLEFEYTGSARFGQRYLDECIQQLEKQLPLGYSISQKNYDFWGKDAQKQYGFLALVVVAVFFICTIHFESFRTALLIVFLIPMSFIGIFLTFYWFDFPFDQGGYTSFLLLSGIVVNSMILILSDYRRLIRRFPFRKNINLYLRAFRQKITPIYLTIISTALGLLPFTMHGSGEVFWFALAAGTIGGLLFSLAVIWVVVPLFIR